MSRRKARTEHPTSFSFERLTIAQYVSRFPAAVPALLVVLLLLPFLGKCYHIDDPLFVWAANHIQSNPADPFGFTVNWFNSPISMSEATKNPPGICYYLAAAGWLFGFHERVLHAAMLLPAVGVAIASYLLARYFCKDQMMAAILTFVTPVFLVSATTVMSDVGMLCLWLFAIYSWMRGTDSNRKVFFMASSLLMPLCALTKYYGAALIPLLFVYSLWRFRRGGLWLVYFIFPILVLIWYQWITNQMYGRGLLADAANYATEMESKISLSKFFIGLVFSGGCVATILFFSKSLWSWKVIALGAVAALAVAAVIASGGSVGKYSLPDDGWTKMMIGLQFGIFAVGGLGILALAVRDFIRTKTPESGLLLMWVGGTFLFAAFVNWSINGRSILPMVPAVAYLIVRRMEEKTIPYSLLCTRRAIIPLLLCASLSFLVAWGDLKLANVNRVAAERIHEKYGGKTMWFQGHWGFQYYFEGCGGKAIDVRKFTPSPGDYIVIPTSNTNLFDLPARWTRTIDVMEFPIKAPASTMNVRGGAGFYADIRGVLPFTFNPAGPEKYVIQEVFPPNAR